MKSFVEYIELTFAQLGKRESHSNVYGYARSLFALSTLFTLLFNDNSVLFPKNIEANNGLLIQSTLREINLFWLLQENLLIAKFIAITILVFVLIGIYPKLTVIPHWWISSSFLLSCKAIEGGDQLIAILTLLFIPIGLTDSRKWHWSIVNYSEKAYSHGRFVLNSFYIVIRIQIFILYLQAFIGKLSVSEWVDGTVLYYWFEDNIFGLNESFRPYVFPVLENYFVISALTYSVLIVELTLALVLVMKFEKRRPLLILGVIFHLFIWFIHGLPTFFITMCGALVIYIVPFYKNINLEKSAAIIFKNEPMNT
ncbi:sporulation-delaying protein SdpB family protein [Maribacter sp. 2-571]|uniref:sporulation-delaying protein SdpB family protein n=1 Tax=Maribacter sp. 2-571 TaxID=3417569 RepID=UPI003D34AA21